MNNNNTSNFVNASSANNNNNTNLSQFKGYNEHYAELRAAKGRNSKSNNDPMPINLFNNNNNNNAASVASDPGPLINSNNEIEAPVAPQPFVPKLSLMNNNATFGSRNDRTGTSEELNKIKIIVTNNRINRNSAMTASIVSNQSNPIPFPYFFPPMTRLTETESRMKH